ncbi:MAG: hypothetical protein ACXVCY_08680 [Pseudobdellovibrionaceae bacterium]
MDSKNILFSIVVIMTLMIRSAIASPVQKKYQESYCSVVHVQAQSSASGVSLKKQGVGWIYQYPESKEFKVVLPFHVIDLGVPLNSVELTVSCNNRKLSVEKGMFSTGVDLATLKVVNPPPNLRPLITMDLMAQGPAPEVKWQNIKSASGFFSADAGLLPMDLGPSYQIIDNPFLLNKTAQVYRKYLEFPQFDSLLFMPFIGVKFGSSGSPVFLDYLNLPNDWKMGESYKLIQRPVGMILKTLIGENVTLVLPLQKLAENVHAIDAGKDPFKAKFPEFEIRTVVNNGISYRQLLWFTDAKQNKLKGTFTETCGMDIKWGNVGGWGDGGGNKKLTGNIDEESLNSRDLPKLQDQVQLCDEDGIIYQDSSNSKILLALRDPYNPRHIVRLTSIHRLLEFFNRLKKGQGTEIWSRMVISADDLTRSPLSPYELFCSGNENFVGDRESGNPILISPLKPDGQQQALNFNGGYYLKKGFRQESPIQIKCDSSKKEISVIAVDKANQPLSILAITDGTVRFLFQSDLNRMNWDENWSFKSTNASEVVNSLLDDPPETGLFLNDPLSSQKPWSYKKRIGRDTTVEINFDSGWEDDTPKIVIEVSKVPENQNAGMNWSGSNNQTLKLQSYKSRWYFHAF